MQVVVNNILVNYTEVGSGPVIIAVHGWMHDHSSFTQLGDQLKDEYRIIALDLPNFGTSQMTDAVLSTKDYAELIAAFVQKLSIQSYTYMGHSMGCQIGMYGTGAKIINPNNLILISPAGVRNNKRLYKTTLKYASKLLRRFVPKTYKAKFYRMIGSDYTPDLSEIHKKVISRSLNTDVQQQAAEITVPTLLIDGTLDRDTPLWMAQILNKAIKGSTLDIIKGGDHFVHQLHADTVAKIVRTFLS